MKTLLTLIGIALVSLAGFAGYQISQPSDQPTLGMSFRPSGYSGKLLTRLNSGGSESSFNTTPCTTPDGQTITASAIGDFIVITVNPGAANEEKISASTVSCSGTTLTWTITNRGLSFASATSTITANKKQHAIGETVIISNDDQFLATQYVDIDGVQTIAALKTFTSGAMFSTAASSTDECTGTSEYCTKDYIDNSVNQGAATSTEALGGIVELATALEVASSTDLGSTRPLVLQAKYATSTPAYSCNSSGTIGALCTVIARNSGKIHQLWIDLTEDFTFTGALNIAASVTKTLTLNTLAYVFPTSQSAGTALHNDGSGNLTWGATPVLLVSTTTTTAMDYATTTWSGNYQNLRFVYNQPSANASLINPRLYFNSDRGLNYGYSAFEMFTTGAGYQSLGTTALLLNNIATSSPKYTTGSIINMAANRKFVQWHESLSSASTFVGTQTIGSGVWNNTSTAITSIVFWAESSTIPSGTIIEVYGSN